jgi:hypothetical protein
MEGPIHTWVMTRGLMEGQRKLFLVKRLIFFEKNQEILYLLFGTLFGTKMEVFFGSPSKFLVGVPSHAIEFHFIFQNFRFGFKI